MAEDARGATVRFAGVAKSYDGRSLVVEDLDLAVERGEFLTLLGPSGSGKTTCLMMLAGFEMPSAGTIAIDGAEVTALPAHRRGVGVVFQNYALFPHMTVAENVGFPLRVRGLGRAEIAARTGEALGMVELGGLGARMPGQLSGGQQQRVALARALVFRPRLVLLDEPLGALDKALREQMQGEIRSLHRALGMTMVYVTHDQGEALTMSDRIAVFHRGRIRQLGPPASLYEQPANAFVAGFIGESNRLAGRVAGLRPDGLVDVAAGPGGAVLAARPTAPLAPGAAVVLSIRPERLRLLAAGDGATDAAIAGTLAEIGYHGDHLRLAVEVPGLARLVCREANRDDPHLPAPGEPVRLGWRSRDLLALSPEE